MESNSLKGSSIQTVHSIELKFYMYIIGHHWMEATDFGEFLMHSFFNWSTKKNSFTLWPMESNSVRDSSI